MRLQHYNPPRAPGHTSVPRHGHTSVPCMGRVAASYRCDLVSLVSDLQGVYGLFFSSLLILNKSYIRIFCLLQLIVNPEQVLY